MAIFSSLFKSSTSIPRITMHSHDDDDDDDSSSDIHIRKALLEGEQDNDSTGSPPPPYRSKQRRAIGSPTLIAVLAIATLLFGLLTLCFFWHIATLKSRCTHSAVQDMPSYKNHTTIIPDENEDIGPEANPAVFANWKDCGTSVAEARAKGCQFDVMLHSWLHADCFDQALMDDYLARVPYHWYRDWKLKEEITVEEMRRGEHGTAAVNLMEHGTHCAYVLEKNLRSSMNGKAMAKSIFSVKHAVHCIGLIVNPDTIPGDYTQVVVEYDRCGVPHFD